MILISCISCPTATVVDPPIKVFQDFFHPQIVKIIQPIEVIKRHHCVPIPCRVVTFAERDVACGNAVTVSSTSKKSPKSRNRRRRK